MTQCSGTGGGAKKWSSLKLREIQAQRLLLEGLPLANEEDGAMTTITSTLFSCPRKINITRN